MLQEGLYSLLISTSSITDLTGTRGIFSGKAPETPVLPIVVLEQIGGEGIPVFEGISALRKARLTFSCYANSNQGVKQLMKAVRDLLDGYKGVLPDGTDVDLGQVILETGSFEFAPFIYRAPLDIEFWFREP